MAVVRTDKWIAESHGDPYKVCRHVTEYFPTATAAEIHLHLIMFGMYITANQGKVLSRKLQDKNVWDIASTEVQRLESEWNGPSVPVFIFPADVDNKELIRDFNGKAGVAYEDKLFLFISPHNTETEIRALLTHEYNHVCRLNSFSKREDEYTLLDTIILEGLAEMAVEQRFGKTATSLWTSLYSDEQLARFWKAFVHPNRHRRKETVIHQEVLYGSGHYPKMTGYAVGYYLVRNFLKGTDFHTKDMLALSSTEIARLR